MYRKIVFILAVVFIGSTQMTAQRLMTRIGYVKFFSSTPIENIEATTNQAQSIFDLSNGSLVFKVSVKSFVFEKQLMQEHFNENYMESNSFPDATFSGRVTNLNELDLNSPGVHPVQLVGKLKIHNVEKEVSVTGTLESKSDKLSFGSTFQIKPEDYGIEIPNVVREKIAQIIEVTVLTNYQR